MKIYLLLCWLCFFLLNSQAAQTSSIQQSDLEKLLKPTEGDSFEEIKECRPLQDAVNSAGPEIIPQLETFIRNHKTREGYLENAFDLLCSKLAALGDRSYSCRNIVLENVDCLRNLKPYPIGLQENLIVLLGKCGHSEDAPIL